jgi:hypothetical protein
MSLLELHTHLHLQKAQLETQVRCINCKRHTDSNPWMTRLQINLIARYMKAGIWKFTLGDVT